MLPGNCRIKKKKDIEKIFKKGSVFKEDFLVLRTMKNGLGVCRFCFVVPKKVSSRAYIRNKAKRRMRESVRLLMEKLKPGSDNLLIALAGAEKKDWPDFNKTVETLFKRAKIYG